MHNSSSCAYTIHVKIDLSLAKNQNPKPELEEGEFIECFTVPLSSLYAQLRELEDQGYAIDGRLGAFADGIETAKAWNLAS